MQLFLIILLSLTGTGTRHHIQPATRDSLWQKAVAIAAANAHWVPGLLIDREITKNDTGETEETTEVHVKLFLNASGGIDVEVLKVMENSQDVTDAARSLVLASLEEELAGDEADNPFAPDVQPKIQVRPLSLSRTIGGRRAVGFAYTQQTSSTTWQGSAWLDAETGVPLSFEAQPQDMPPAEDKVTITALSLRTTYNTQPEAWYPTRIQVDLAFVLKYALVFTYTGTLENTTTLQEYWHFPIPVQGPQVLKKYP